MRIASAHGETLIVGEGQTRLMGIVNVTPDSFSDGGLYLDPETAIRHGLSLAADGAHILDIGGESTRPGHEKTSIDEQIRRIVPVIEGLRRGTAVPISIDTTRAAVAEAALAAGADWINDTTALAEDPGLADVAAAANCPIVLMHRFDPPRSDGAGKPGSELIDEVVQRLTVQASFAKSRGIDPERILLDPGLGFGTLFEDNLVFMANIAAFRQLPYPLVVGPSRKSFIGRMTGKQPAERVFGTAAAVAALANQGVEIIRVHDVAAMVDVLKVADSLRNSQLEE